MKFTVVLIAALSITCATKINKSEEPKDKREAPLGYPSLSGHGYQTPALSQDDASSISIGAGYSVGGAKQGYSYPAPSGASLQQFSAESLPASGHATIQLAPITLQGGHGFASSDLSQLMSQLSQSLNSGALTLQGGESYQPAAHGAGQELSLPQYTLGAPKLQQYAVSEQPSVPSYAVGTKGLGSYSSGPVLFTPSESQGHAPALSYGAPSGHSLGGASGSGNSFYSAPSGGQFAGFSGSGHSFGEGALSLGGSGHSLPSFAFSGAGHSFGAPIKAYGAPSKTSFKPSAFLGASVQGESGHGLSTPSGSYGAPSFDSFGGGNHGALSLSGGDHSALGSSFSGFGSGSSKFNAASYLPPKSSGFGSSYESVASFSSDGHLASPPGTTYGVPTSSYGVPSSAHAASSSSPQYYVPSKSSYPSFGGSSSSYRAPSSGYSSLSSHSSGPKQGFSSHHHGPSPSSRYGPPRDIQGSPSETSYNTIKYSEEFKPHMH